MIESADFKQRRRETHALLYAQFLRSGMFSARTALDTFVKDPDDIEGIALHSGRALESWCKAFLLTVDPALIIGVQTNSTTLKVVSGLEELGRETQNIKTIGGIDACARMQWIYLDFPYLPKRDQIVFDARDAAAHGTPVSEQGSINALRIMIRLVNWICTNCLKFKNGEPYALWDEHQILAERLVAEQEKEYHLRALARLENARRYYNERFGEVDLSAMREITASIHPPYQANDWDFPVARECPVCSHIGWLCCAEADEVGTSKQSSWATDSIEEETCLIYPMDFRCQFCGLVLESEELDALDMAGDFEAPASLLVFKKRTSTTEPSESEE